YTHHISPSTYTLFYHSIITTPPRSTLFPYTTLFRSLQVSGRLSVYTKTFFHTLYTVVLLAVWSQGRDFGCHPNNREKGTSVVPPDRKSTRLNSSHSQISYAVFCLKKKNQYREFGEQYDMEFLDAIKSRSNFNFLHNCGTHIYFDQLATYPVHALSWAATLEGNPDL